MENRDENTVQKSTQAQVLWMTAGALGVLLLAGALEWSGAARLMLATCAGLVLVTGIFAVLQNAKTVQDAGGSLVSLVCLMALGASAVFLNLERSELFAPSAKLQPGPETVVARAADDEEAAEPRAEADKRPARPAPATPTVKEQPPKGSAKNRVPPLDVERLDALNAEGARAYEAEEYDKAQTLFARSLGLIDAAPSSDIVKRGQIAFSLAQTRVMAGDMDGALRALDDHAAKLDPSDFASATEMAKFLDSAAQMLGNAGKLEASLPRFQQSAELGLKVDAPAPLIASTYAKMAISLARLNRKADASDALARAKNVLRSEEPVSEDNLKRLERIGEAYGLNG